MKNYYMIEIEKFASIPTVLHLTTLQPHPTIDFFCSGSTIVAIFKQVICNYFTYFISLSQNENSFISVLSSFMLFNLN